MRAARITGERERVEPRVLPDLWRAQHRLERAHDASRVAVERSDLAEPAVAAQPLEAPRADVRPVVVGLRAAQRAARRLERDLARRDRGDPHLELRRVRVRDERAAPDLPRDVPRSREREHDDERDRARRGPGGDAARRTGRPPDAAHGVHGAYAPRGARRRAHVPFPGLVSCREASGGDDGRAHRARRRRLTQLASALPETEVEERGDHVGFFVRGRHFAWYLDEAPRRLAAFLPAQRARRAAGRYSRSQRAASFA